MIGAKALTSLVFLLVTVVGTLASGVFRPQRLALIQPGTAFFIGCFAIVLATFVFRFLRLSDKSQHYFRWATEWTLWEGESHFLGTRSQRVTLGENTQREAFDLPGIAQYAVCIVISLLVCVATFDARSLQLLEKFTDAFSAAGSSYCPDAEEEAKKEEKVVTLDPGCALVRRAFELGYADTLGDCGEKKKVKVSAVCTLRQRDEPVIHYAFRRLSEFAGDATRKTRSGTVKGMEAFGSSSWRERMAQLFVAHEQVMSTSVHASHHIWTNLPDPGDGAFKPRTCVDKYRTLPHRPLLPEASQQASLVFEHILGQLLFETRYQTAVGYCREYQVHWNAPVDACQQLTKNPVAFLDESGALKDVRSALERFKLANEVEARTGASMQPSEKVPSQRRSPQEFLSFSCFMEVPNATASKRVTTSFKLDGNELNAADLKTKVTPPGEPLQVKRYGEIATLLAPGFHYGVLLSEAGLDLGRIEGGGMANAFSANDFPLSRLHGLASLDIFLEPDWISKRPDLLEVYPYHLHLKNYVQLFRRQYTLQKGRL